MSHIHTHTHTECPRHTHVLEEENCHYFILCTLIQRNVLRVSLLMYNLSFLFHTRESYPVATIIDKHVHELSSSISEPFNAYSTEKCSSMKKRLCTAPGASMQYIRTCTCTYTQCMCNRESSSRSARTVHCENKHVYKC